MTHTLITKKIKKFEIFVNCKENMKMYYLTLYVSITFSGQFVCVTLVCFCYLYVIAVHIIYKLFAINNIEQKSNSSGR